MWWQQRLGEFVTLFLVVNPFAALPTFLAIAAPLDPRAQRKLALGAAVISFAVLVFFVFAGAFLLQQMGISIRAFLISGGILLFVVALGHDPRQSPKSRCRGRRAGPSRACRLSAGNPEDRRARRHAHGGPAHRRRPFQSAGTVEHRRRSGRRHGHHVSRSAGRPADRMADRDRGRERRQPGHGHAACGAGGHHGAVRHR